MSESVSALARIAELRTRFVLGPAPTLRQAAVATLRRPVSVARPVVGAGIATGFESVDGAGFRALLPAEAKRAVLKSGTVTLPMRANGSVLLEDDTTHLAVSFALSGAADVAAQVGGGMVVYRGAFGGRDVIQRVHAEGTEDYLVFEDHPDREELSYDVDVTHVAGLRLVSNTLEFLDSGGAPRLRMAPPYLVDATGERHEARIAVDGCAVDSDPSGPWGRALTRPNAASCVVRVIWADARYPLILDPAWTTTGSLITKRSQHTATMLSSGKVLIAGGQDGTVTFVAKAELFDGTGTFAATGGMRTGRVYHTATLLSSGKVLIAGGESNSAAQSSAELFDGTGTFTFTGSMIEGHSEHTATLLNSGKVLIAGGGASYPDSAELFDGTSTFAYTGSMRVGRGGHTATLLSSGKVLIAGGLNGSTFLPSAELFDGTSNFAPTGSMTTGRFAHTATRLNSGKVLIAGGKASSGLVSSAELFDGTSAFTATGSMAAARVDHTATLLGSGKVLVAGGYSGADSLASTELFDGTGSFAPAGSMTTTRDSHTATLLNSGKVLVAAGDFYNGTGTWLTSAELFALVAAGGTCSIGGECVSSVCEEGTCCSGACSGPCMTCTAGTGACTAVKTADDPDTCTGANTCDASGACKLKVGQVCLSDSGCASGHCADGFCCGTACAGACDVCAQALGAPANGTCGNAPAGYSGQPACAPSICNGMSSACANCTKDADCVAADYCSASGTCQLRLSQGVACNQAAQADCLIAGCHDCASGNCVDGVCCDTACTGTCQACAAAKKGSGADGTCGGAAADTDPHSDCADPSPTQCAPAGLCDGSGACESFVAAGKACGATTCTSGTQTGLACDGSGTCAQGNVACAPYSCGTSSCNTTCATASDCAKNAYCDATGHCIGQKAKGTKCGAGAECSSTFCVDGFCCDAVCSGACQACDVAPHPGTCSAVSGAPHGNRTECRGTAPCGGTCDGVNTGCSYPSATVSCGTSCANDQETDSACDGKGACATGSPSACPGWFVCDGTTKCKSSCATDADCSSGFACAGNACAAVGSSCEDDSTAIDSKGAATICDPYRCESGACRTDCASIDDCASGSVCDTRQQCVPQSKAAAGSDSSGCGCRLAASSDPREALLAGLLGVLSLVRLRRRKGRASCSGITTGA